MWRNEFLKIKLDKFKENIHPVAVQIAVHVAVQLYS
jgi:hypothetical protein